MPENDLKYLVASHSFSKFGPMRIKRLKNYFPSFEQAFRANAAELKQAGIEENVANEFQSFRLNINPDELMARLAKENIKILTLSDDNYPRLLNEIYDPPPLLFYQGELKVDDDFSVAVVGARKYSHYGQQATEKIVFELAKNKITIISGLALGIDALAHQAALAAGGRTIAVLGSGIDKYSLYPADNRYLAEKIVGSNGLVLSEFPLGTPALKFNFPQRNRIISGLARGTLVVEAGEKSGSLITANFALDQNREVFAVPGNIFSDSSVGTNNLIKKGAKAITSAAEILEALDLANITSYINSKTIIPESPEEEIILALLSHEPIHVDELIRSSALSVPQINSTLVLMEMKGMVKNLGNQNYVKIF
ncbi:MAG: DNA-processing protein DprA [Candidatus Falkowbacteria bacterium]|nr:DNA-processing protein DprA [Candidatus Falkowbacteria bacterium]